jgi:hypothetical protein
MICRADDSLLFDSDDENKDVKSRYILSCSNITSCTYNGTLRTPGRITFYRDPPHSIKFSLLE